MAGYILLIIASVAIGAWALFMQDKQKTKLRVTLGVISSLALGVAASGISSLLIKPHPIPVAEDHPSIIETPSPTIETPSPTIETPSSTIEISSQDMTGESFEDQDSGEDLSRPGPHDMAGCDYRIVAPEDGSWGSEYITKYVKSRYGVLIYLLATAEKGAERIGSAYEATEVVVCANQNGYALIKINDICVGWVKAELLASNY